MHQPPNNANLATPISLAILISGGGTTLQNLAQKIKDQQLHATIELVISSKPNVAGLNIAKRFNLPTLIIDRKKSPNTTQFSQAVFGPIRQANIQLVCAAGFLSLLDIPDDFTNRVLNIHPSLLPNFGGQGMFGQHVHQAVLNSGNKTTGCTVHYADNTYDTGPILLQKTCPVKPDDTPTTLAQRVFELECVAYPQAINQIAQGKTNPT